MSSPFTIHGRLPRRARALLVLATLFVLAHAGATALAADGAAAALNQLTDDEKAAGWKLLFDGKSTAGWHSFKKTSFPEKGWVVEDGSLKHVLKGGGGDIVSEATYSEFDLTWEWSLAKDGNSGLKYFVSGKRDRALGHEYQLIDPPLAETGKGAIAGFYDVLAPTHVPATRPAPEFNQSRILVKGNHVEHWLNGEKTVEYELGSDEVKKAVAASKFRSTEGFGTRIPGHILLQDHGGEIRFRNMKIRDLSSVK